MSTPSPTSCKQILQRLRTLKGHLSGVEKMIEEGADCSAILVQIAALSAILEHIRDYLLEEQLESCLRETARLSEEERARRVREVVHTWTKLMHKK
ncbi:MAG: CsoR family transcriptional regulator, copper-sensing transcriptional repressor [Bacillota bacterium]|nr:CsoR family transcriptional regulator, copper-sensing transcriptional repressor [Bacillota bacterium]MDK2960862.1 CsoR family transcriptional regulator, copper-sensing transcriptional repressor [Bacillota bacterium]